MPRKKKQSEQTEISLTGPTDKANLVAPKELLSDIIRPSVQFDNVGTKAHVLAQIFDGNKKDLPIIKSVGVFNVPGYSTYFSFVMQTKGREVISIEVEEPNLRSIAEESAKMAFIETFMTAE